MKTWKKSVLGGAMAGALLMGGGAVPAQAAEVVSASNGALGSRGITVTGTYTVDCDFAGQVISANLNLYQNTKGGSINESQVSDEFTCKSDGQVTRNYTFIASVKGYVPGPATIRVGAFYTDEETGGYTGVEDIEVFDIRLRNSR